MSRPRSIGLSAWTFAVVLGLAACKPEPRGGAAADAAPAADSGVGGDGASGDGATDRPAAGKATPPCLLGGTRADLPTTIGCPAAVPGHLVVAGDSIYWTVQGPGPIVMRAPLIGGPGLELARDTAGAYGLAVDDQFAYYGQPSLGRIMRVPLTGGLSVTLTKSATAQPIFLVKDGASLYWTDAEVDGKVMKLDLTDGAQPVTLMDGLSKPRALAVRDGYVYWTDLVDGTLMRTLDHLTGPADASVRTASQLASGLTTPTDLMLVGDYAYVPDGHGFIQRVPLAGGALEVVVGARGTPYGIATDGVTLYWSTLGVPGAILEAPFDDDGGVPGQPVPGIGHQNDPHFVAVTSENIYWAVWGASPAVNRIAK
jgi:hypothetical protein